MIIKVIEQLKQACEQLDEEIQSASRWLRPGDTRRAQSARMKIQEAITTLLESDK